MKPCLFVLLAACLLAPIRVEARPPSHPTWHHGYPYRHGPHFRTSIYFGPSAYYGLGYDPYFASYGYGRYYYSEPAYAAAPPSRAANGLFLGALAGAIIGNNSGDLRHNAWRGAALGAATGYILGAVADHRAAQRDAALASSAPAPVYPASSAVPAGDPTPGAAPLAAPKPAPHSASTMADANRLFGR